MTLRLKKFTKRFISPVMQFRPANIIRYARYFGQLRQYRKMGGFITRLWPILGEDTRTTTIDPHYFYQSIWTAQHISQQRPAKHVDVGSQTNLVGFLSTITHVTSVEIRPLDVHVENLTTLKGSILDMPFADNAIPSLSCLHVAEHIGLGRYGDPLDPLGTQKACRELSRVLAHDGHLYFSLPIGKERTEFNAHRIHNPRTIVKYFSELVLTEFSAVNDAGTFLKHANINSFGDSHYACGLFRFSKEMKKA